LQIFAFAVIELIDSGICENHQVIIDRLNAGAIVDYLTEKYGSRMPLLQLSDLSTVNASILLACGGDASFYLTKYPGTNNGLTVLMNLIINAF
jgi:hypothetical protein